eukprot:jgi/Astpho2/3274/fgenesh1_pm.00053_%23_4_t
MWLSARLQDSAIFYAFWEAESADGPDVPILLWLQGGPGCAGLFGALYELGPFSVNNKLGLEPNPGSWANSHGLLVIDQPIGTGFSTAGSRGAIPTDEMEIAADIYEALQGFFQRHSHLQARPLFITGESYAGKYVPSINVTTMQQGALKLGRPRFTLRGLAIGNGMTDPQLQVLTHADTAHFLGLIDLNQRVKAMQMQLEASQLIAQEQWEPAHQQRELLLGFIKNASGAGTMLDPRRTCDYDADHLVDAYLNQPEVKAGLGAQKDITFVGCSEEVNRILSPDVMKSVKHLFPDLLATMPVLLYQGQYDVQDGPACSEAWISSLQWSDREAFAQAKRVVWRLGDDEAPAAWLSQGRHSIEPVAGYVKHHGPLTLVVVREAGHMVPHDQPLAARHMIENWVQTALGGPRWLSSGRSSQEQ